MPPAVLQSTVREWQGASIDGLNHPQSRVLEIKCGEQVYQHVARYDAPPRYYVGQLQPTLCVTRLPMIHLLCYWPGEEVILLEVERDQRYIDRMLEAEEEFVKRMRRK